MSDHKHGTMDIVDHEKTFAGFMKLGRVTGYICIVILIFLAITST